MSDSGELRTFHLPHRAMRLDLERLEIALDDLTVSQRQDELLALARWFRAFSRVVRRQMTVEDELFWPALAAKVGSLPEGGRLLFEHDRIDAALTDIEVSLSNLEHSGDWVLTQRRLIESVHAARRAIESHLEFEESIVIPLLEEEFTAEERAGLEAAAHAAVGVRDAMFLVPWVASVASDEERAALLETAPLKTRIIGRMTRRWYARVSAALDSAPAEVAVAA